MTSMTPYQGEITVLLFTGFREAKAGYTESQHHSSSNELIKHIKAYKSIVKALTSIYKAYESI